MTIDHASVHRLKNQLAIILGFCELMLEDAAPGNDRHRQDLLQIQAAAKKAIAELPPLPAHEFNSTLTGPGSQS